MKSLKLAVIVSAVMLSVAGLAQAENTGMNHAESVNRLNHNFTSKRPYLAPLEAKQDNAQFEGATLITDDAEDENSVASKNARNQKQLRINSLSKRPYME